jgi:hypothetical protein
MLYDHLTLSKETTSLSILKMQLIYKKKSHKQMYKLNINNVTQRRHIYTLKRINYKMYKFSNMYTLHIEVTFIILYLVNNSTDIILILTH